MTWRGCVAGGWTSAGGWLYCTGEVVGQPDVPVGDGSTEGIGVDLCAEHKAEVEREPGAWVLDSWPPSHPRFTSRAVRAERNQQATLRLYQRAP